MKQLTQRQREVLAFVEDYVRTRGFPPSVRDIATHLSLVSASGVHKHIKALVRKNYLSKEQFTSRSLRILRHPEGAPRPLAEAPEWPITGVLREGRLHERPGSHPAKVRVPGQGVGPGYAVVVEDDTYGSRAILPGDTLLISPQATAVPGQLLAMQRDGLFVLRDVAKSDGFSTEATLGVLVGLWRAYRVADDPASPGMTPFPAA